ncbi:hypothetical protein DFH09DRAFT_1321323 [Mycena vulgaris]|nr:hypothetical protein DFH09DRAFT_1321323 [Mycena vulgaris]
MEFRLSCGAEDLLGDIYDSDACPFQPQILPIPLEPPPSPSQARTKSNGCGTGLHWRAIVSPSNMWRASEMGGSRDIVPLESCYFSEDVRKRLRIGEEMCGCSRMGVGCAICGNALGALYTPCNSHQTSKKGDNYYVFLPSAVSPPIPPFQRPSIAVPPAPSPRIWHPLPPRNDRRRHPTSPPPPPILYASFTPTPSPELLPDSLPPSPPIVSPWRAAEIVAADEEEGGMETWVLTVAG